MSMFSDFDAIQVGDSRSLTRTISEADVRRFVEMTGDDNPLHVDRQFAETTAFKDIVVHGMLGAAFISTVIGTQLPGPGALWVAQNLEFLAPVRLGDTLTVLCTVLKKHERDRLLELETTIRNQHGQTVLSGQGKVKVLTPTAPVAAKAGADRQKTALVTGAGGGIGRAIALRLAQAGFNVVANYHSRADRALALAEQINAADTPARAVAVRADVSTEAGVLSLLEAADRSFGGVDVLVNNASPVIGAKGLADTDWSDIQTHLDVQVKAAFLLARAATPAMTARGWGRIISITSQAAEGQPTPGWTGYALAKSALASLSRQLAAELGPSGVTVNCVAPGMTETALIGAIPEKVQLMTARQTPLRRLATPEDVAAAVAYLASDDGAFVTGHTLSVNGGMAMR